MDGKATKTGEPSWLYRRWLVYAVVVVCFALLYRLIDSPDTRVNDTIAWSLCMIIMVLVAWYTGAATVQDIIAMMTMRTARPYADVPLEPTPAPLDPAVVVVNQPPAAPPEEPRP